MKAFDFIITKLNSCKGKVSFIGLSDVLDRTVKNDTITEKYHFFSLNDNKICLYFHTELIRFRLEYLRIL